MSQKECAHIKKTHIKNQFIVCTLFKTRIARKHRQHNFVLKNNKKHMPGAGGGGEEEEEEEEEDGRLRAVVRDSSSLPAPPDAGNAKKTSSALLSECALRFFAGFEIFVDTWKKKTNVNARTTTFYFLTHAHQDHLRGLREDMFENDANGRIYCTEITKVLLVKRYPRLESKVKVLEFDSVEVVRVGSRNGDDGENNNSGEDVRFNVYTLDAGHCPGSAMFVFEGTFGKVLHTGDFRREDWSGSLPRGKRMSFPTPGSRGSFGSSSGFRRNFFGMINDTPLSAGMWSSSSASLTGSQDLGYDNSKATALKNATPLPKVLDNSKTPPVDVLYLDNTYNNPAYDHPPRTVALERIVKLVTEIEPERPVILLLDSLGKEDIVIALSQATKSKVYLHKDRYNDWLKLGFGKEYVCNELGKNETTRVRVLPKSMGRNKENVCGPLVAGLKNSKEWGPLVINPTGWARVTEQMREEDERRDMDTERREKMTNEEKLDWVRRSVPYSLHSSYRELETFVRRIQPRKIIGNTRDDTLKEAERKGLSEVRSVHVRRLEPLLRPSSQSEENPMLKAALEAERGYERVAATTTKMNASKLLARMRLPSHSPRDEISDVRLLSASSPRGVKGDVKETLHKMRIVSPSKQATKYALANKKLPLRLQPIDKEQQQQQQQQQQKDREEENPEEDEMEEKETPEELSVPPLPPNRRRLPLPKSLTTRGGTAQKQRSNTKNDTHVENNVVLHSSEEEFYNKSNLKSQPSVRGPSKQQIASRMPLVSNQKSDGFDALNAFLEKRMREREKRKEVNDGEDGANIFENEENDKQDDDAEKKQEGEEEEEEVEEERQKQSQETVEDDDDEEEDDDDIVPTQSADGAIGHGTEEEEVTATPVSPSKWFSSIIAPVKRLFFRGGEKKIPSQQQSQVPTRREEENEEVDDRTTTFITAKVTDAEDNDDEARHDGGNDAPDDAHEDTAGGDGDDDEEGEEGKGDAKDLDNNNSGDGGNGDEDEDDKNDDEDDDMPIRRSQHRVRKLGSPPTDEELKEAVFEIVDRIKEGGGKRISPRETREELEKKFGCSLKAHKENIQKYIYFRTIEQDTTIVTTRRRNNSKERNRLKRKSELKTEQEEDVSEEEEEAREEEKEEKPEVKKRPQRKKKVKKLRKLNPLRYADSDASSEDDEDDDEEEEEEEEDRDDAGNSGDDDDDDDMKDEMVDKDSESTDEEGKPPPKKQRINSTGAGQQQPQSFRQGRDVTRKQMTRMRATLQETQGSIPGTRSGAKRKAAKESLNEREPKERKEKGAGRVRLLPTLPEMERAPPGTFYATAHLELPRDVLERMVFEKTGKDYSLWQNPKVARWKLALMLDEGGLLQAIADEKIKPTHVEKKKTGSYYVKKAERLAMEKQYQELSKAKKERGGQVEEGQDRGQPGRNNVGGDGSDLQPKTIRFFGQGEEREDSDDTEGGTVVKSEIEEEEEEEQDSEDDNDLRLLLEKMQVKRKMSERTLY